MLNYDSQFDKNEEDKFFIYKNDSKAYEYLLRIKPYFGNSEQTAKENLFFVSTKFNLNVKIAINSMLNNINQKEDLWNKQVFEDQNNNGLDERDEINPRSKGNDTGFFSRIFYCCYPKTVETDNKKDNSSHSHEDIIAQEDDVPGYDENYYIDHKHHNSKEISKNTSGLKEEELNMPISNNKGGGCILY